MRSLGARLALALGLLAVPADAGATPGSGNMTRTGAPGGLSIQLTNGGSGPDLAADLVFPEGTTVSNVGALSGAAGSCTPDSSQPRTINCFFDPPNGWPSGSTIMFDAETTPPLADNAGAQLFTCGIPCDTTMKSGPYSVTGPSPLAMPGEAELEVTMSAVPLKRLTSPEESVWWGDVRSPAARSAVLTLETTVRNHGPADAENALFALRELAAPPGTSNSSRLAVLTGLEGRPGANGFGGCFPTRIPLDCDWPVFPTTPIARWQHSIIFRQPGSWSVEGRAASATPDPGALPNVARVDDEIVQLPWSLGADLVRGSTLEGLARGAPSVRVGVARELGGAKVASPPRRLSGSQRQSIKAGAAATACRWLTSKRIRFRRERGRRCDEPSYLTARVRRGRWRIRLSKKLPPGRYVVITRAVSRNGLIEASLGPRLGNLKRFRVR